TGGETEHSIAEVVVGARGHAVGVEIERVFVLGLVLVAEPIAALQEPAPRVMRLRLLRIGRSATAERASGIREARIRLADARRVRCRAQCCNSTPCNNCGAAEAQRAQAPADICKLAGRYLRRQRALRGNFLAGDLLN